MVKDYTRRIYLIEKRFQFAFILKFCALVAAGGLLTIAILYFLALQSATVSFVNSRVVVKTTADFILPVLIQTVVITMIFVSIAVIAVTLFVSHKIAGPLYRLRKTMKEIEAGDFSGDFRIRHLDQLQELANSFNGMVTKMRQEVASLKGSVSQLKEKLDEIGEGEVAEQRRQALRELKQKAEELQRTINYFKT